MKIALNILIIIISFVNSVFCGGGSGLILDSILIDESDFILPQPPISKIKSPAVYIDWRSKFTPVSSISFVFPSYVLLQYQVGWQKYANDSIPLFFSILYDSKSKQKLELKVDKSWKVAGVQPDGRVIFAERIMQDEKYYLNFYIARIEP